MVMWTTHKVHSLCYAVRTSSGPRRLDLARINLSDNSPSHAVSQRKYKYSNNHHPSCSTIIGVNTVCSIQYANEEHAAGHDESTGDDRATTAPCISVQKSGNGDEKHENCRDTGSQKRRGACWEAGLREEDWSILQYVSMSNDRRSNCALERRWHMEMEPISHIELRQFR